MCLLSIIDEESSYGYEMVHKLRQRGLDLASEGSIYPLLSRLQKQGIVSTEPQANVDSAGSPQQLAEEEGTKS